MTPTRDKSSWLLRSRNAPELRSIRCLCGRCGAHVVAETADLTVVSGVCGVCGSYDVRELEHTEPIVPA